MTWVQWTYLALIGGLLGLEMWAVFNDRGGDTITAMIERTPYLWVPTVVLCGWALAHFLFGHVWLERSAGLAMLVFAPVVWYKLRPDKRNRS